MPGRLNLRIPTLLACWVGLSLTASTALAAEPTPADRTLAQSLFEQGRALMAAKDYANACPKLAESQRLDASAGTLLNLAVCHEEADRLATAWAEFNDAATAARMAGEGARAQLATSHEHALQSRLAHLTVNVHAQPAGLTATLDGASLGSAAWSTPLPVDVGAHGIVVSRDGHEVWRQSVDVRNDGDSIVVDVPAELPGGAPAAPPDAKHAEGPAVRAPLTMVAPAPDLAQGNASGPWKTVGWIAGGVGVAGLGVGAVFGVVAMSDKNAAHCDANGVCDHGTTSSIKSAALVSDVGWIAGGVLLASGAALVLLAPGHDRGPASLRVAPAVVAGGAGAVLGGSW